MVLRLKTRESRSPPGLPSARSSHIRIRIKTNLLLAIVVMHVVASKPLTLLSDMHDARQTGIPGRASGPFIGRSLEYGKRKLTSMVTRGGAAR